MAGPDLVQVTSPSGVKLTVGKDAAEAFTGLLAELEGQGYQIDQKQSGGYANRNIAGTNTPSQHSFGHAVDINWNWNPRGGSVQSDMPPNIGDLAAKHGLIWGGNWSGNTRDPMHFEYNPARRIQVAAKDDDVWSSLGNKTPSPGGDTGAAKPSGKPGDKPEADHDAVWTSLGNKELPAAAPTERYGPQAQEWGIPGPPLPTGAPGPPVAPPPSTGSSVGGYFGRVGMGALNEINTGLQQGVLAPGAQRSVESVPVVGPVLGEVSKLAGGLMAVPAAVFHAGQNLLATGADAVIPPNAGGPIGPSLAAGLEVSPMLAQPGFRGPTNIPGGAAYVRAGIENALNNRTVPLPSEFRAQPFAPGTAQRVAAGPISGASEPTGVPPPPPGGIPGPTPRPKLSVGPEPESVGAAGTPRSAIPDPTLGQALANLEKEVNQSAEDRAGPQQVDQNAYVPGIPTRPLASRVFNAQNALDEKVLRAKPEDQGGARDHLDAIDRDRNQGMVDILRRDAGDANTFEKAKEYRREAAPDQFGAFEGEGAVDASHLLNLVDGAMNESRAAKSKSITSALQEVKDTLLDKDGNPETLPSRLYGARQNLTDLLDRSKGVGDEAAKLRAATAILTRMVPEFDRVIGGGAPRYQLYMDEYRKRSQVVNQHEFLQKYTEGTAGNKITDSSGYLQLTRVQKLLNDILQEQKRTGTSLAKSLTDEQIQNIINVRNELAAAQLRDRKASVRGSDSFQQFSREAETGSGPLGTALRAGGNLVFQGGMAHLMGLDPTLNALGMIGRGVITPSMEAARARSREATRAAKSEARKNELLNQGPPHPLSP